MANNNVLTMNEEEIQTAANGYRECSTGLEDAGSKILAEFQSVMDCGLMSKSVSEISKQLGLLSGSIGNVQNIMSRQSSKMFDYDRSMAKMAEEIDIPDDFFSNNSMETNEYNRSILGKIDGRSVNEGQTSSQFNETADNTVSAQSLADITADQTQQKEYDETTVIGKSVLGNISGNQTQEQTYDASTNINRQNMADISGNQTKEQTYDDSSSLNKATITNISGDQTQQKEYDETTVLGKSVLGNVNKNSTLQQQELDGSSTIAATNLGSVNRSKAANINDELMLNTQAMSSTAALTSIQTNKTEDKEKEELEKIDERFENMDEQA